MTKNQFQRKHKAIASIIPDIIFYDTSLSSGAKVFYGMLVNLNQTMTEIKASTFYLKNQMSRSSRSITGYIKELDDAKYISVSYRNKVRILRPLYTHQNDLEIAAFIPPEVVRCDKESSSAKLTYGYMNYSSGNSNCYFESTITEIAFYVKKSRSTIYRHLARFRRLQLLVTNTQGNRVTIRCFNSYQRTYKVNRRKQLISRKAAPPIDDEDAQESTLTDAEAEKLRELVLGSAN